MEEKEEFTVSPLEGAGATGPPVHPGDPQRQLRTFLRESQRGGGNWADHDWYLEQDPKRIAEWALIFLRLTMYMREAPDTNPYIRAVPNAQMIRAKQKLQEEKAGFVRFMTEFLDSCTRDIFRIHYAVLGLEAHIRGGSGNDNQDYLLSCHRLLTLFVNICSGMFMFTEKTTPTDSERLPRGVRVQMIDTYFVPVNSIDEFQSLTLRTFIDAYRKALGYVIIGRRITQAFGMIAKVRSEQARAAGGEWGGEDDGNAAGMRAAYVSFTARFAPFIEDDTTMYLNTHAKKLSWLMNEALDVAYVMVASKRVGKDFMTGGTEDSPPVVDLARLYDLVLAVVRRIMARRKVLATLPAAKN